MYASTLLLAVPVIVGRFFIVQSPNWLAFRGRIKEAEEETERLLLREPRYPKQVIALSAASGSRASAAKGQLVRAVQGNDAAPHDLGLGALVLAGRSTYGIGIFTPTILATLIGARIDHPRNTAELIQAISWPPRAPR